jgi:hypothetical protein
MARTRLADGGAEFTFLRDLGLQRVEAWETGIGSSRDGWRIRYAGRQVDVTIDYLDWQFDVVFERNGLGADYLFLDRELFGHRSGLHGNMLPPEKLPKVVAAVARDIRRLAQAPREKPRLP